MTKSRARSAQGGNAPGPAAARGRAPSAPSARIIAARVVERVNDTGSFLAAMLEAELSRAPLLDRRDGALATELAYGTVRSEPALLATLGRYAPRGLGKLDSLVRAHLAVAAYQLLVLDRIPGFAAVNEAVLAIRKARGPRLAGFANAVLRRLAASGDRLSEGEAIAASVPVWLRRALEEAVGLDDANALLGITPWSREVTVRVRVPSSHNSRIMPAWVSELPQGQLSPYARKVQSGGDLRQRDGFSEGAFTVQDEGSQVVALALGARPGERVLDACAGRGQKTSLLAEQLGDGELWATDLHEGKLARLHEEFARLGLRAPKAASVDWSRGCSDVPTDFDRVLVDAPCSGVGTLRHRPEILRRLQPGDPARLGQTALAILRGAAQHVRPGGRVVFSVCSVLPEECEHVVQCTSDLLERSPLDTSLVAKLGMRSDATSVRLLPHHGTDGYFIASFLRR